MKVINKGNLQVIVKDIEKALAAVGQKHGVVIQYGRGKYSNGPTGSVTLELAAIADDGTVVTRERKEYLDYGRMYDLKPEWLDRQFTSRGEKYVVLGLDSARRKFPIVCRRVEDSVNVYFTVPAVIALLEVRQ